MPSSCGMLMRLIARLFTSCLFIAKTKSSLKKQQAVHASGGHTGPSYAELHYLTAI